MVALSRAGGTALFGTINPLPPTVVAGLDPAIVTDGDAAQLPHPSRCADQVRA
jgi:hypothetical protein